MLDIILDINGLSIPDLIARVRAIKRGAAGQEAFSTIADKLAALEALTDTLAPKQLSIAAAQATVTQRVLERDAAEAALITATNEIALDVGRLAPGEAAVAAAALRVRTKPGPRPVPARPTDLELTVGDEEGEIIGRCRRQARLVDFYERRWTTADPNAATTAWTAGDTSKKSRFELTGLPAGQKIWVQVRACNTRGKSPWCDPASVRVP